jgi:hypothetical protein
MLLSLMLMMDLLQTFEGEGKKCERCADRVSAPLEREAVSPFALYASAAAKQVENQNNKRQHQQQMNPPSNDVKSYKTNGPEDDKDDGDGPKHK